MRRRDEGNGEEEGRDYGRETRNQHYLYDVINKLLLESS